MAKVRRNNDRSGVVTPSTKSYEKPAPKTAVRPTFTGAVGKK